MVGWALLPVTNKTVGWALLPVTNKTVGWALLPVTNKKTGRSAHPTTRVLPPVAIAQTDCASRRGRSSNNGFTLLEVLLASALAATMLIGLWSLLSMQTRLFARAPLDLERCQLVRALYQQIADDLHTSLFIPKDDPAKVTRFLTAESRGGLNGGSVTAQDAVGTSSQASAEVSATVVSSGTGRPSALIGSGQSLHLQVMQVPLPQTVAQAAALEEIGSPGGEQTGPRVPELRDVTYTFYPPGAIGVDSLTYQAGLIRREISWDAVDSQTGTASVPWIFRPETSDLAAAADTTEFGQTDLDGEFATQPPRRDLVTYVPEVVGIEFRYFDGSSWDSSWDSHQRQAMPVAVEVKVDFGARQGAQASTATASAAAESSGIGPNGQAPEVMAEPSDLTAGAQPTLNPNIYRFVIFLPSGTRQSGTQSGGPSLLMGGGFAP